MNIKNLADNRKWTLSQIGVLAARQIDQMDEEALHIEEALAVVVGREGFARSITVTLNLYYSPSADVLCWPDPPSFFYPGGVLFNSYVEFLQWIGWRLVALGSPEVEVSRVVNEMEGWKVKAHTRDSVLGPPVSARAPMVCEIQLR